MTNSPSITPGHRVMTPEQIALIEKVRALGIAIEGVLNEVKVEVRTNRAEIERMRQWVNDARASGSSPQTNIDEREAAIVAAEPERWLAMARTDLQTGLMKLTRSIAQPGFF